MEPVDADIERAELQVVRTNRLQQELQRTTNMGHFLAIRQDIVRDAREAAELSVKYQRLADLWRGLELNNTIFLRRLPEEERQAQLRENAEQARLMALYMPVAPAIPTSIAELLPRITNLAQAQALQRLLLRHDNNQMYLSAYQANPLTIGRAAETEGTFTILGTMRKGARESYTVKWYRLASGKPSFWCNCPDHKFNSTKKNMVCKHICFLVAKVGRILDPTFFETKRFTPEQHEAFKRIVGNAAIFTDGARERERLASLPTLPTIPAPVSSREVRAQFAECRKPVGPEDSCPICYDSMVETECLNCPTCSNNVHRECMEVWLERNLTCVYCRSEVWQNY